MTRSQVAITESRNTLGRRPALVVAASSFAIAALSSVAPAQTVQITCAQDLGQANFSCGFGAGPSNSNISVSTSVGTDAIVTGDAGTALGDSATATTHATAVGFFAIASSNGSTALGDETFAIGGTGSATAVGSGAVAGLFNGPNNSVGGNSGTTAVGTNATAGFNASGLVNATAVGDSAQANAGDRTHPLLEVSEPPTIFSQAPFGTETQASFWASLMSLASNHETGATLLYQG